MSKTLAIIGCGHLGLQIAHFAITDLHFNNVVFFDDFTKETTVSDFKILGTVAFVEHAYREGMFDELIVGIGYKHPEVKKEFFERFKKSIPFATIIHKSCHVDPSAVIKAGSILYPNCCIDANVVIGNNVIVNLSCTIAHDSVIAAHNFIAPAVIIAGFVKVGSLCMIGIGTVIIDNIKIIDYTVTGGGTVVIRNIEQKGLYAGNPAKFIR